MSFYNPELVLYYTRSIEENRFNWYYIKSIREYEHYCGVKFDGNERHKILEIQ